MNISRRDLLARAAAGGAAVALPLTHAWSQTPAGPAELPVPSAVDEARAPALPRLGAAIALPSVPLLAGGRFEPAQAQGQVLVLYWWASWCPFCAVQSPHVEALWRKNRARGLQVLALSIDRRREDALAYIQKKGYSFPAAMLTPEVATMLPKPKGLPVTVVRGRAGTVVFAEGGEMFPEDVEGLSKFL